MGDCAGIVRLEGPHNLEGRRKDPDDAIGAAEEDAFRAGDDGGDITGLVNVRLSAACTSSQWRGGTSVRNELSSSGSLTRVTSKNLNCHCDEISERIVGGAIRGVFALPE